MIYYYPFTDTPDLSYGPPIIRNYPSFLLPILQRLLEKVNIFFQCVTNDKSLKYWKRCRTQRAVNTQKPAHPFAIGTRKRGDWLAEIANLVWDKGYFKLLPWKNPWLLIKSFYFIFLAFIMLWYSIIYSLLVRLVCGTQILLSVNDISITFFFEKNKATADKTHITARAFMIWFIHSGMVMDLSIHLR